MELDVTRLPNRHGQLSLAVAFAVKMPLAFPPLRGLCKNDETHAVVVQSPAAHAALVAGLAAGSFQGRLQLFSGDDRYANVVRGDFSVVPEYRGDEASLYSGISTALRGSEPGAIVHVLLTSYAKYEALLGPVQLQQQLENEVARLEAEGFVQGRTIHVWQVVPHPVRGLDEDEEEVFRAVLLKWPRIQFHARAMSTRALAQHLFGVASAQTASETFTLGVPGARTVHYKVLSVPGDTDIMCGSVASDPGFYKVIVKSKKPEVRVEVLLFLAAAAVEEEQLVVRHAEHADVATPLRDLAERRLTPGELQAMQHPLTKMPDLMCHVIKAEAAAAAAVGEGAAAIKRIAWLDGAATYAEVMTEFLPPFKPHSSLLCHAYHDAYKELKVRLKAALDSMTDTTDRSVFQNNCISRAASSSAPFLSNQI